MRAWLLVMGVVYEVLGLHFIPAINASQFTRVLTGWSAPPESTEFKAVVDWMWTFGLDLVAIGLVAIIAAAAGSSAAFAPIVWVIIAREFFGGIVADAGLILHGYANRRVYGGFVVFHVAVIASGLLVLR